MNYLLSLSMTLWFFSVIHNPLFWLSDTVLAPQSNVTRIPHLGKNSLGINSIIKPLVLISWWPCPNITCLMNDLPIYYFKRRKDILSLSLSFFLSLRLAFFSPYLNQN